MNRVAKPFAAALLVTVGANCSRDTSGTPPAANATESRPGVGREGGAAGGRRSGASVVLSASDVAAVGRATIEEATPISGDLNPVERVDVRARLEGDLVGVYVREGERVRAGQLLARFEGSEQVSNQRSAEADRAAAAAELSTAQWNAEQTAELYRAGAVAERDNRAAQQAVAAARARVAAAEARVRSTSSVVTDTRVLSPTTGTVEKRLVENGEHVAAGTSMFSVVRNDVLELAASVPARQAAGVVTGQTVHFTADGRSYEGRVARVSPTVDPVSRAITVYAQVPNAGGAIKGGTFASGRVVSRTAPNAVAVPTAAVRQSADEGQPYVYRIDGTTLATAAVRLGIVDEARGLAEVLDGLREGDRVVVGNVGTLGKGMQVQVAAARDSASGAR